MARSFTNAEANNRLAQAQWFISETRNGSVEEQAMRQEIVNAVSKMRTR